MTNFVEHKCQVEKEFTSSMFAIYMFEEWGVEVGYNATPEQVASWKMDMLENQLIDDCCALCAQSQNPPVTISSYASLSTNPNCLFVPLYPNSCYTPCNVNPLLNNNGSCIC